MIKALLQILAVGSICCLGQPSATADYDLAVSAYGSNDYATAYHELLPLAQNGDARAQALVAMMYKYGEFVDVNYDEAFNWYQASANQGYPPAQYSLAELYETGKGTAVNPEQAVYWFTKAAEAGLTRAKERLRQYELSPSQLGYSDKPESWSRDWNLSVPMDIPDSPETTVPARAGTKPATAEPPAIDFRVQLGAMKSVASANRLWEQIKQPNQDLFEGVQYYLNGKQTDKSGLIRVQVGDFPTREDARDFCDLVKARGIKSGCLTTRARREQDIPR